MKGWSKLWRKTPEQTPVAEPPSRDQKSLAFNVLFHQLREGRRYRILDLGPGIGRNIDFFSRFSCSLQVEDLIATLNSFDYFSPEDGFTGEQVFAYLMPYRANHFFDVILAWDVFNYLERDVLGSLLRHLGRHSRGGTLMFALLATNRFMPETPHRFVIQDEETLSYQVDSSVQKTCPRYEGSELSAIEPHFRICNSFVLRNGYREYLFLYE